MLKGLIQGIALLVVISASVAGNAKMAKVGPPTGPWQMYSEQDAMTDKTSCIAYYNDDPNIQLTTKSLAFSYRGRGGVSSYTLRLANDTPLGLVLASDVEKHIGAVLIEGDTFKRVMAYPRLRMRVSTLVSGLVDEDLDLTNATPILSRLFGPECR